MSTVEKLQSISAEAKKTELALQGSKVKAAFDGAAAKVEESSTLVTKQMALYLDNPATQSILLKPITRKISKSTD